MRVSKLNSPNKLVLLNTKKYLIDWENDGNSSLEKRFRELIKPYWTDSIVLFQMTIPGSLLKIDFFNINKRLAIEIDGPQHDNFNPFLHKNSRANYLSSIKRDINKDKWCEDNNIKMLHINEEDLDSFCPEYIQDKFGINII